MDTVRHQKEGFSMVVSARYALRVAGFAVAFGLTMMTGHPVASADDGTGSPAPGPSSVGSTSSDSDVNAPPLKAGAQFPTMTIGNGRAPGDKGTGLNTGFGSMLNGMGQSTASGITASSQQAEADEVRDMERMLESSTNSGAYADQMMDTLADMKSQMAEIAANSPASAPSRQLPG
jgi:hypothetical protein